MIYFWFKAFHIIGVVIWLSGLLHLQRLFIYHAESLEQTEPAHTILTNQYKIMEKRLYNIIATPGMVVTVVMAIGLLISEPGVSREIWLHIKVSLAFVLIAYHFYCGYILKQLATEQGTWNSRQLRILNEVPIILLVGIVLLAVFKNSIPTDITSWGIIGMIVAITVATHLYAKRRKQSKEKLMAEAIQEQA